jgi:hypothetical protein
MTLSGRLWPCPVDGSKWELTMDGECLVPFGTRRREPAGRPREPESPVGRSVGRQRATTQVSWRPPNSDVGALCPDGP